MARTSFLSEKELSEIGFAKIGKNALISRNAAIYSPEQIELGDNVRIDDFCILSGKIKTGSYIHISAYTALYGKFGIELEDFVTVSGRVMLYSQSDDYSGKYMTNPMVPPQYINVTGGKILLKKHSIIAAGSIVFPSITLEEGAAIGAMSLVNKDVPAWTIYAGIPCKYVKDREQTPLKLEEELRKSLSL